MLSVQGTRLRSSSNGRSYGIGTLELMSLSALREGTRGGAPRGGRTRVQVMQGDVRRMHRSAANAGALFQVASQFNLLEMSGPDVTPEDGVTRYEHDHTQGPACAIAAGAATIYRNYFVPVGAQMGQTRERQLDCLSDLGAALSAALGKPVDELWTMKNGYALCTQSGLDAVGAYLAELQPAQVDDLRGKLRIGVQWDAEVTDQTQPPGPLVSQVFCSALPVAYSSLSASLWEPFARLVLEATYQATMWAAVSNALRGASNVVYLTFVGGGAFGNQQEWIHDAIRRALTLASGFDLDVRLVSYGPPSPSVLRLAKEYAS